MIEYLKSIEIECNDFGAYSNESTDYPDYVHPLAKSIKNGEYEYGIVICGSGNGVNITANKYMHIRSALCWIPEIASLARKHNNANVLAMPGRFVSIETACEIVKTFFSTEFEGGRHQQRVSKMTCF